MTSKARKPTETNNPRLDLIPLLDGNELVTTNADSHPLAATQVEEQMLPGCARIGAE